MPHTFHAEYSTASQQNQVPWAALEGGVLMQQEIGHFESCNSVAHRITLTGTGFSDTHTFQTCMGGSEGKHAVGEGPCNPNTSVCGVARTEGTSVVHDAVTADCLAPSQAPGPVAFGPATRRAPSAT